jgi:hypothetical protein
MEINQKDLVFFTNRQLFERKLALLSILLQRSTINSDVIQNFQFHGLQLNFLLQSPELKHALLRLKSNQAILQENSTSIPAFSINFYDPRQFSLYPRDWTESVSDCWSKLLQDGTEVAFQRDFIATRKGSEVRLLLSPEIQDGLDNFLRWLLPTPLLAQKAALIHSSAVVLASQKAYVFLGASGAGKTTIAELARPRRIISDDMNILFLRNHSLYVRSAAMGGKHLDADVQNGDYMVQAMFWLHQGERLSTKSMNPARAAVKILSSMANLNWEQNTVQNSAAFNLAIDFARRTNCMDLTFPLSQETWNGLDPLHFSKKRTAPVAEA